MKRFLWRFVGILTTLAVIIFLCALNAAAQTTNGLSEKEIQGRELAQKLLDQQPAESFTNTGVLQIRHSRRESTEIPVTCKTLVTAPDANWESIFEAGTTNQRAILVVIHTAGQPNQYFYWTNSSTVPVLTDLPTQGRLIRSHQVAGAKLTTPFAGSDFWLGDLGLEFLHWPDQKFLRGDTARGRLCKELQSTNPNPSPNGYSRVLTWIDKETFGIIEAKAYDANGKKLKEFYPKDFKKVNGQWEVGSMDIYNDRTGSRTRLKLDLKK